MPCRSRDEASLGCFAYIYFFTLLSCLRHRRKDQRPLESLLAGLWWDRKNGIHIHFHFWKVFTLSLLLEDCLILLVGREGWGDLGLFWSWHMLLDWSSVPAESTSCWICCFISQLSEVLGLCKTLDQHCSFQSVTLCCCSETRAFPRALLMNIILQPQKRLWELRFLEGKTGTFLFFPSKSNFLKSLLFYPTHTQSKGPRYAECPALSWELWPSPIIRTFV